MFKTYFLIISDQLLFFLIIMSGNLTTPASQRLVYLLLELVQLSPEIICLIQLLLKISY